MGNCLKKKSDPTSAEAVWRAATAGKTYNMQEQRLIVRGKQERGPRFAQRLTVVLGKYARVRLGFARELAIRGPCSNECNRNPAPHFNVSCPECSRFIDKNLAIKYSTSITLIKRCAWGNDFITEPELRFIESSIDLVEKTKACERNNGWSIYKRFKMAKSKMMKKRHCNCQNNTELTVPSARKHRQKTTNF